MKIFRLPLLAFLFIMLMGCSENKPEKKPTLSTEFLQYTNWSGTLESVEVTFNIDVQFTTDKRGSLIVKFGKDQDFRAFDYSIDSDRILNVKGDIAMILNSVWLLEAIEDEYLYLSQNHYGESKGGLLKLRKNK